MIAHVGASLAAWAERWVPSPFVLALGLTAVVAVSGAAASGSGLAVVDAWVDGAGGGRGLWALLAFSMQMCLILVTGYALAETAPVKRTVRWIAAWPTTTRGAVALVSVGAMSTALLNWGLGLIVGALLAREVGREAGRAGHPIHYPLVVAAGYTGLMVWHGGLSGSAPLKVSTKAQLADVVGPELAARVGALPLTETIMSPATLVGTALCLVGVPLILAAMAPQVATAAPVFDDEEELPPPDRTTRWVLIVPVILGVVWLARWVMEVGLARLDPNVMNLAMLILGLVLHGSAEAYARAAERGVRACAGIILQYPFYAGIMGIMTGTGLVAYVSGGLSGLGPDALAVATFYLGGLVNLFVPSGGGQWAVQGPIVLEAAEAAGADPGRIVLALAYGDQWTNMVQPFWALPLLGICKVKASQILGYTLAVMLVAQVFFLLPLVLMP